MLRFRLSFVLVTLIVGTSYFAWAGSAPNLNVSLTMDCRTNPFCYFDPGNMGSAAFGYANFDSVAPGWSMSFDTGSPTSWDECPFDACYFAQYGSGGGFSMTAPGGLTFSGYITGGSSAWGPGQEADVYVSFRGKWSNGLTGSGSADEYTMGPMWFADLSTATVAPEPGTLCMLGSGLVAAFGIARRRFRA